MIGRQLLAGLLMACGAIGCGNGSERAPKATVAANAATHAPALAMPASTSAAPAASVPAVPAPTATTGIVLPPDLGHLVLAAPGISTPGDIWELAPKLWLFLPSGSADDSRLTPPKPEDQEILIAYARKQKALNLAAADRPMTLDSPAVRATYTPAGAENRIRALAPWSAAYLELGDGLVFRPRVASEPRTADTALVLDCYLDATFFAHPTTGEAWPGENTAHRTTAVFARLARQPDGRWLVDLDGGEDLACA